MKRYEIFFEEEHEFKKCVTEIRKYLSDRGKQRAYTLFRVPVLAPDWNVPGGHIIAVPNRTARKIERSCVDMQRIAR